MGMLAACLITVTAETAFFALLGYRDRDFIIVCVCANAATNLSLNLIVRLMERAGIGMTALIYPLEALAVAAEYFVYARLDKPSWKLFGLTLAANALSYCIGLAVFGHV